MEIEVSNDISLFNEVALQARVLVPMLHALRQRLGKEQADELVASALRQTMRGLCSSFAAKFDGFEGGPSARANAITAAMAPRIGNDVEIEWIARDTERADFNVTRCRYAELFRDLGEPDLGSMLVCETDLWFAELAGPEVELRRTVTLMTGGPHCDFRFRYHP